MERVVHKSNGFKEAEEWDIEQQVSMTPEQRMEIAKVLRDRAYPVQNKDVREWHRSQPCQGGRSNQPGFDPTVRSSAKPN